MFDDEDFNIFDDKQVEQLNAVDKKDDDKTTDLAADDQAADDAAASEDNKADDEGKSDDDKSDDKSAEEDSSEADKADDDKADDDKADDKPDGDAADDDKADDDKADDKADDDKSDEEEKFATKEDIKSAIAEQAAEAEAQKTARQNLRKELRDELFPEGIDVDLKIKDSDNGIITGPSQIAGKLINPDTQELFTYEEAKDFWDNAQKQIDIAIEQREQLIDKYAENNQSFFEGSQKVEAKYGEWLKKNPKEAKKLLDGYLATAKVTKTGYITEMPLDVEGYYDTALGPMASVASQLELQKKGEEDRKAAEAAKNNQSDRADLPVNSNTPPPVKKDALSSAFDRYFEGK